MFSSFKNTLFEIYKFFDVLSYAILFEKFKNILNRNNTFLFKLFFEFSKIFVDKIQKQIIIFFVFSNDVTITQIIFKIFIEIRIFFIYRECKILIFR